MAELGQDAVGVGAGFHAQWHHLGHALRPFWRIEPGFAQVVEALGCDGDGLGGRVNRYFFDSYRGPYYLDKLLILLRKTGRNQRPARYQLGALVRRVGGAQALGEGVRFESCQ